MTKSEILICIGAGISNSDMADKILSLYDKDRQIEILRFAVFLMEKKKLSLTIEEVHNYIKSLNIQPELDSLNYLR